MTPAANEPAWRKSTYSNVNGSCVEVAPLPGEQIGVRHSKQPSGPSLSFSRESWGQFIATIKSGDLR